MTWWSMWPTAALLVALLVLPGWPWVRLLGARGVTALAAAPVVSAAILGAGSVLYSLIGVRWAWYTVLPVLVLLAALGTLAYRRGLALPAIRDTVPRWSWAVIGAAVLTAWWLIVSPVTAGIGFPDTPTQGWDGIFHLNAVATIVREGDASPLGGLASMYGTGGRPLYPTLFHALTALAGAGVVQNLNLMVLVMSMTYVLGLAGLASWCTRGSWVAAAAAPLFAASFVFFPPVLVRLGQYPYVLGIALLPSALLLVAQQGAALRQTVRRGASIVRQVAGFLSSCVLAVAGLSFAHMTMGFVLLFIGTPLVMAFGASWARRSWRQGDRRSAGLAITVAATAALVFLLAMGGDKVREMADYPRPDQSMREGLRLGLFGLHSAGSAGETWVVAVTVLVGALVGLLWRPTRWLTMSWLVFLVLFVIAYGGHDAPMHALVGPWYGEARRIQALVDVFAALLAGISVSMLARALGQGRKWSVPVAAILTLAVVVAGWSTSGGFRADQRRADIAFAHAAGPSLAAMRQWGAVLPQDAVVIADPWTPAIHLPAFFGVRLLYPHYALRGTFTGDYRLLLDEFNRLHDDPAVCQAVNRLGVTHFVQVPDGPYFDGSTRSAPRPGLYGVDTSTGFTLLARSGDLTVWRIDACRDGAVPRS
jgi:hypothetical protein